MELGSSKHVLPSRNCLLFSPKIRTNSDWEFLPWKQKDQPPYLPSYNFVREEEGSVEYALPQRINNSDALEHCVRQYGGGDLENSCWIARDDDNGLERFLKRVKKWWKLKNWATNQQPQLPYLVSSLFLSICLPSSSIGRRL
jgi:hypothetical protein